MVTTHITMFQFIYMPQTPIGCPQAHWTLVKQACQISASSRSLDDERIQQFEVPFPRKESASQVEKI